MILQHREIMPWYLLTIFWHDVLKPWAATVVAKSFPVNCQKVASARFFMLKNRRMFSGVGHKSRNASVFRRSEFTGTSIVSLCFVTLQSCSTASLQFGICSNTLMHRVSSKLRSGQCNSVISPTWLAAAAERFLSILTSPQKSSPHPAFSLKESSLFPIPEEHYSFS